MALFVRLADDIYQDVRFGLKMLLKNPGLMSLVLLCLAVGIGLNTSIFSLVNLLLLRPLQVPQPGQLVVVTRGEGLGPPSSYPDYVDYRDNNKSLSGLAAASAAPLSYGDATNGEVILGGIVSGNYFSVLGAPPMLGRALSPEEDRVINSRPVAVLSHKFWERRFNSDRDVVGKEVKLNGHQYTVIGVMSKNFSPDLMTSPDLWLPMMMLSQLVPSQPDKLTNRQENWLGLIGRLKPGEDRGRAQTDLNLIDGQLAAAYPDVIHNDGSGRTLTLTPANGIQIPHLRRMISLLSTFLIALVSLVLLIACANVANILLAKAATRQREIAIRQALGARRSRLLRQVLTESMILSLLGGAVGLLIAYWSNKLLSAVKPPMPPPWSYSFDVRLDGRVLIFTFALSVVTGMIFGMAPALRASKADLTLTLKDEPAQFRQRYRSFSAHNLIVIAQVAVSLVLLISAAIFTRSLQKMQTVDPGFKTDNAFFMSVDLEAQGYDKRRAREFYRQLGERIATIPGVQSVSRVNYVPLGFGNLEEAITVEGKEPLQTGAKVYALSYIVDPEFFKMMGISILRGRGFTVRDQEEAPAVAVINEEMARHHWPGEEPIGKRFQTAAPKGPWYEVIGVAKNAKYKFLSENTRDVIYLSCHQAYAPNMDVLVRASTAPSEIIRSARGHVKALDEKLPVKAIMSFEQVLHNSSWLVRIGALFTQMIGLLSLLLTLAGVYGVVAYSVARRTREIGIRIALGAMPRQVIQLIIKQGFLIVMVGLVIGLALAFGVSRLLASFLYGVSVTDPIPFLGVPLLLVAVTLVACYIPARRGAKLNPSKTLRIE